MRCVRNNFKHARRKPRKPAKHIVERRRLLSSLTRQVERKGSRSWPKYGSARQLTYRYRELTGRETAVKTIHRDLKVLKMKPYVRPKVPTRRAPDIAKRREFASKLRTWAKTKLHRIVFSDESWVDTNERTSRLQYAKRRCDVLPRESKCRWNTCSIMVFGCVGIGFRSPLVILPAKVAKDGVLVPFRLSSDTYIRRCLQPLVPLLLEKKKILQQDGARSHASKQTRSYLSRKGVPVLESWPAYSPDLNAIERCWHDLKLAVGARSPSTQEELIKVTIEEWNNMSQKKIDAHCRHFYNQLQNL